MLRARILAASLVIALLASCSEPVADPPESDADAPDNDFEIAQLQVGQVDTHEVWVPSGYSVVDMNNHGDLLLGAAWLPNRKWRPLAIPFVGRSINNRRQVLGPSRAIFRAGRVTRLPDPCVPFTITQSESTPEGTTFRDVLFDCSQVRVHSDTIADSGDAVSYYWHFGVATAMSPFQYFKVWRAATREWTTVLEFGLDEHISIYPVISDAGVLAHTMENIGVVRSFLTGSTYLSGNEACPSSLDPPTRVLAVNDSGETVGLVECLDGEWAEVGVRWSREGIPTRLGGTARLIDNYGNAAGIRDGDGHAVVWLVDGSVIDLSAAVGNQPASVRKFLKRGQIFGFAGTKPVVWRFGF